jgi:hypothetical protein
MLPPGFSALGHCLPSHDGFLFSTEPLDLLLDSEQLLFHSLVSRGFFLPVLQLDLFELRVSLYDLYWRGCPWRWLLWGTSIGLGRAGASSILVRAHNDGEHVVGWMV